LLIAIPALQITVKPALGDHPFVKLKVVAQNRWSVTQWRVTYWDTYCHYCQCKWQSADIGASLTVTSLHPMYVQMEMLW